MAKKSSQNSETSSTSPMDYLSSYKRSPKNQPRQQKQLSYIYFPPAVQEALGVPGFPVHNCSTITGYSDTGKTTLLLHTIIQCQKQGILPVIVSTEGKFSFEHAKFMGMDCDYREVVDEDTGELIKVWDQGFFVFKDDCLNLEEMYGFIIDFIQEEILDPKSKFPFSGVCFFVDSLNKLKSKAAVEKIKEDNMDLPMHNAKAHKNFFSGFIEPFVTQSKYKDFKIDITFIAITRLHAGSNSVNPKETGGLSLVYDMAFKIHFGGMLEAAVKKIPYKVNGKTVSLAKETKVRALKNHITGVDSDGPLLITPHGFISATDKTAFETYKKENKDSIIEYFTNVIRVFDDEPLTETAEFEEVNGEE